MKKLPKVGTLVVLKNSSELSGDVAEYFHRALPSKTHRTFRVIGSTKRLSGQLTLSSVLDSNLRFDEVDITEVKKL